MPATEEDRRRTIQDIGWVLQRQLNWGGITLASGVGLIGLLNHIQDRGIFKILLYQALVFLCAVGINKTLYTTFDIRALRDSLNGYGWTRGREVSRDSILNITDRFTNFLRHHRNYVSWFSKSLIVLAQFLLLEQLEIEIIKWIINLILDIFNIIELKYLIISVFLTYLGYRLLN